MKDFSREKFDFYSNFTNLFKDKLHYKITNDDEKIYVEDTTTGKICTILFEKDEYEMELQSIKHFDDFIISGKDYINCILFDSDQRLSHGEEIRLEGNIKGIIKKDYNYLGVIVTNIDKIFNADGLDFVNEIPLSNLINQRVVLCEIKIDEDSVKDKGKLSQKIYSVLAHLSYNANITLEYPKDSFIHKPFEKKVSEDLNIKEIKDTDCMQFFLSAEKIEYPHFKYIEYYHILEYYFLESSIEKMGKMLKDVMTINVVNNQRLSDKEYYDLFKQMHEHFLKKGDQNTEIRQLKEIINSLGYFVIATILNGIKFNCKILKKELFNDDDTKMNFGKEIFIENEKKLILTPPDADQIKFCDELAIRIYKIRNYCVHTKKSENRNLLTPTKTNLDYLNDDLNLIRALTFAIMINK